MPQMTTLISGIPARSIWLHRIVGFVIPLFCAWVFYVTLSHEAQRKVLSLQSVENYAFAVYNQLLYNFSREGHFFQTIHRGYDDNWMWSGHKAGLLPVVSWLYGLRPSPVWLAQLQLGAVALGAFPAYHLGRLAIGGIAGGLLGLALYFGYPPLYHLALQDYQDTALAMPALMVLLYFRHRQKWLGFALACLLACLVREEIALMVALLGFGVPGTLKQRATLGFIGAAVAALYLGTVWLVWHGEMTFEAPAQSQFRHWFSTFPPNLPPILYDKQEAWTFYSALLSPLQWLSVGSPLTLLPGLGGLFVHVHVNPGNGVERVWAPGFHIHHLAPIAPLFIGASIETLGSLMRLARRLATRAERLELFERIEPAIRWSLYILAGVLVARELPKGVEVLKLEPTLSLASRAYPVHPVWTLVRQVPLDAVIATDTFASLAVSARRESYTYDESIQDKLRGREIWDVADYLLINARDARWKEAAMARPGAELVGQGGGYWLVKVR